jgi:hypothetical protein
LIECRKEGETTELNLQLGEGDFLRIQHIPNRLESWPNQGGGRVKQTVRMLERDRTRESFPDGDFIDDHSLTVRCSPDGLWPSYLSSPGVKASGRVSYLHQYLKIRGCLCPEKTAGALLDMSVSHLVRSENFMNPVQLILQEDIWSRQVVFLQQNKSRIMDMIQDLWQLLNLLSSAACPPVELTQNSADSYQWPNT